MFKGQLYLKTVREGGREERREKGGTGEGRERREERRASKHRAQHEK